MSIFTNIKAGKDYAEVKAMSLILHGALGLRKNGPTLGDCQDLYNTGVYDIICNDGTVKIEMKPRKEVVRMIRTKYKIEKGEEV